MLDNILQMVSLPTLLGIPFFILAIWYFLNILAPNPQGVRIARFTRLWYFYQVWKGHFEETNIELHKRYGKIVQIGPRDYSIDDPEAITLIYGHGTKFEKSDSYKAWSPPHVADLNLFTIQRTKLHASERRKLASMYSMSTLLSYEAYVNNCITVLCQRFDEFSVTQETVNMARFSQCFAFDVIGEITLAKRFGFLDSGHDIGAIMKGLEKSTTQSTLCGIYLWLAPIVFGLFGSGTKYVIKFIEDAIRDRSSQKSTNELGKAQDFLTKLNILHQSDPVKYTKLHIFTGCGQNIVAGSDTTSISLNSIIYYMLKEPRVFVKLRTEIDEAYSKGHITNCESVTFEEAQKLRYLQAVIKEGLRIHAATGLPLWRIVPAGGANIAGQYFKPGTNVGINSWVAHYNTSVFGNDTRLFRPERWLESTPEQLSRMERYYMPFGLGSRTCIGKNISLLEITKVVPQLVRMYDFELVKSSWTKCNHWFVKQSDFEVKICLRNKTELISRNRVSESHDYSGRTMG